MKKLVIYPKDLVVLLGRSDSYCRALVRKMKKKYKKEKHQCVTIEEACEYMNWNIEKVEKELNT